MSNTSVQPKKELHGVLDEPLGIPYTVDFTNADPDAHNYAVKELKKKFKPKERCTMLDYIIFYGEYLISNPKEK